MLSAYLTIKDVSNWLQVKPSTLYAWAAQGKIPSVKMNGLVRFEQDAIRQWLERPQEDQTPQLGAFPSTGKADDLEGLIARAKTEAYTQPHGETRPKSSLT